MSATTAASAHAAAALPVWWEIPRLTARLLWRHWPVLAFWFFAQRIAYDLLLNAAIKLAEHSVLLAWAAMALLIVTQLIGTIAMFLAVQPSLPALASGNGASGARTRQTWANALSVTLLPFFAYYAAWGLLENIHRSFELSYRFSIWYENQEPIKNILQIRGWWIALLVSFALRYFSKRRAASSGRAAWSMLATLCEAYWAYIGVAVINRGIAWLKAWWHERVAYVAVCEWWENPFAFRLSLAPLKRVLEPLWDFATTAAGGMLLALVWLAITAIVYGLDLQRAQRIYATDAPLRRIGARFGGLHAVWRNLADKASAGWISKGVPVVNSLRLVLHAGLPTLLVLCVSWQLLTFIDSWSWRLLIVAFGPFDPAWQQIIGQPLAALFTTPVSLRPALFTDLLRVVLLAATFDCAIARLPQNPSPRTQ